MKVYNGGIDTATGLNISNNTPADDRFVVDTYSGLTALVYKYDGLMTKVVDENKTYQYDLTTNTWSLFGDGNQNLQSVLTNGSTGTTGVFRLTADDLRMKSNGTLALTSENGSVYIENSYGSLGVNDSGVLSLSTNQNVNITGNNGFSINAGAGGQISTNSSTGLSLQGNGGGVTLYGNTLGVTLNGDGGSVTLNGGNSGVSINGNNGSVSLNSNSGITLKRNVTSLSFESGFQDSIVASGSVGGFIGISYAADYSGAYSDRSLIDKGYLEGRLSGLTTGSTYSGNYLPLSGGTLTGTLISQSVRPVSDIAYDSGSAAARYQTGWFANLRTNNIIPSSTSNLLFYRADGITIAGRMFNSTGNWNLGTSSTDSGYRLNVEGTGRFTSGATSNSDVEITDNTKGVILKSPDGTRYRITVNNGGTLTTTAI